MPFENLPEIRGILVKAMAEAAKTRLLSIIPSRVPEIPEECWKVLLDNAPEMAIEAGIMASKELKNIAEEIGK